MSLFTMPDGSSGDSSGLSEYGGDSSSSDSTDLSTIMGLSGGSVGDGYSYTTSTDSTPSSATSQTLGQLQSGGSNINWNSVIQGGLATLVAADSIQHGLTASGNVPTYKASNGSVYPVGTGPAMYASGSSGFGLLLIVGLIVFALAEEK